VKRLSKEDELKFLSGNDNIHNETLYVASNFTYFFEKWWNRW